LINRLTEYSK